ncbi:MAG: hypothetical protein K2P31_01840 [Rickettsiaceae bacterium]|nr:hypothetical protein [Rickettsiaceae bacterium]
MKIRPSKKKNKLALVKEWYLKITKMLVKYIVYLIGLIEYSRYSGALSTEMKRAKTRSVFLRIWFLKKRKEKKRGIAHKRVSNGVNRNL